jgi:RNA polymerase sigma factor (sigma-70 family)
LNEVENHVLPEATNDSWRAWLMTGARKTPLDPRRLQGSHRGLKKILAEGLANGGAESPYTWKDFSGAMVRHAVDDAMRSLPEADTRVVKLAYFGGYSNREIAGRMGMTEAAVERRLRRALTAISDYLQHGRTMVRRAIYWIGIALGGRWVGEVAHHGWQAAAVTAAAVVIVAAQDAPASSTAIARPHSQPASVAPATRNVEPPLPSPTAPVRLPAAPLTAPVTVPSSGTATGVVPQVTAPVSLPSVPKLVQKVTHLL